MLGEDLLTAKVFDQTKCVCVAPEVAATRTTTTLNNNNVTNDDLFDANILNTVVLPSGAPKLTDNLEVRPLRIDDWKKGYLELLEQLTVVGNVSSSEFVERFHSMRNSEIPMYYVVVIEDLIKHKIVASITLVIEFKFIHRAGSRGRVEDLVVDSSMRGKRLGKLLSLYMVEMAHLFGVYKLSLECKDELITYYQKFGYVKDPGNNFMVQKFDGVLRCQ